MQKMAQEIESSKIQDKSVSGIYALALAVSISVWFIAFRAPLYLDETGSYWQISAGFRGIWSRQGITFPAYSYILWLSTKLLGTSEIALRTPSILAMLGAVYLLYLAARELFDRDLAIIAVVIFCLHPIVIFAAIDVRPYAFAILTTNAAILITLRLRHDDSNWLAILLGLLAALIVYFHYLFAVILPALVICFFVVKSGNRKGTWRQLGIAAAVFAVAFLPLIPGLHYLFQTGGTHVFSIAPNLSELVWTLTQEYLPLIAALAVLVAAVKDRSNHQPIRFEGSHVLICASLGLIPLLILYGVSIETSIHLFAIRHQLVAIPGIALCWVLLISPFRSRFVRLMFCLAVVAGTAILYYSAPLARHHGYTWKYALAFAEKNASPDNAPVVLCSDFIESEYAPMPVRSPKESDLFTQLSYYKLSVPVVPLPIKLNQETVRVGSQFLQEATQKHERFLALAYKRSYPTLDWLSHRAAGKFTVRQLGVIDDVEVLEFVPRTQADVHADDGSLRPGSSIPQ